MPVPLEQAVAHLLLPVPQRAPVVGQDILNFILLRQGQGGVAVGHLNGGQYHALHILCVRYPANNVECVRGNAQNAQGAHRQNAPQGHQQPPAEYPAGPPQQHQARHIACNQP